MRKLSLLMALILILSACPCFVSCGSSETSSFEDTYEDMKYNSDGGFDIALVCSAPVKDSGYNQGIYQGIQNYANYKSLGFNVYPVSNVTYEGVLDALEKAAEGGADTIIISESTQGAALMKAAAEYPDKHFIYMDGSSVGMTNVAVIKFQEEQSGYMAGYAMVIEGYTKLGYLGGGGGTNEACCLYGYGFVQGASDAAVSLGRTVEIRYSYKYGEKFSANSNIESLAEEWYDDGVQVIFSCGGDILSSIVHAADVKDGYIVGVDIDQSNVSERILTSACKGVTKAVELALTDAYSSWDSIADSTTTFTATDGVINLPTDNWKLKKFTVKSYEKLLDGVSKGKTIVDSSYLEKDQITLKTFSGANVIYE